MTGQLEPPPRMVGKIPRAETTMTCIKARITTFEVAKQPWWKALHVPYMVNLTSATPLSMQARGFAYTA